MTTADDIATVVEALTDDIGEAELDTRLTELGVDVETRASALQRSRATREELNRLRRREHELGALFASARELAEVRDIDGLLERLVSRAHDMMGSDVTYLSEFDSDTRDLHVRKTIGSVTPQFRRLRVPAGMGLASRIADSRSAQWVQRYSEYDEGTHDTDIDDAVHGEGIVSILGVPMLSDGRVLGVLFSATRQEHVFAPEQIAMLSALADHASIVLRRNECGVVGPEIRTTDPDLLSSPLPCVGIVRGLHQCPVHGEYGFGRHRRTRCQCGLHRTHVAADNRCVATGG